MSIRAVIFDWGGTLTPWHSVDPHDSWRAAVGDADRAARLHAAEIAAWERARDEYASSTLEQVFAAAGIEVDDDLLAGYDAWWDPHTLLDPDVPAVFGQLRARDIRIGVLSNTMWSRDRHEWIFARDEVLALIDGAVYSSEIPWTKPHAGAFRAALAAVGVEDATEAVFVGDRLFDDIYGAKAIGMRAVLVPHSRIPTGQHGAVEGVPDAVVQRLADLIDVIDGWW